MDLQKYNELMFGDPNAGFAPPEAPEYESIFDADFDAYINDYIKYGDAEIRDHIFTDYEPPTPLPTPPPYEMPEPLPTPPPYEPPTPQPTPPPYEPPDFEWNPSPSPQPTPNPTPEPTQPPVVDPAPNPTPSPEPETERVRDWDAYFNNNKDVSAFYEDLDDEGYFAGGEQGAYYKAEGGQVMGSDWEQDWVKRLNDKYGTSHDDVGDFTRAQFGEAHYEHYGRGEKRETPYKLIEKEAQNRWG